MAFSVVYYIELEKVDDLSRVFATAKEFQRRWKFLRKISLLSAVFTVVEHFVTHKNSLAQIKKILSRAV